MGEGGWRGAPEEPRALCKVARNEARVLRRRLEQPPTGASAKGLGLEDVNQPRLAPRADLRGARAVSDAGGKVTRLG